MKRLARWCLFGFTALFVNAPFAGTLLQCQGDDRTAIMALEIDYDKATVTEVGSGRTFKADVSDSAVEWSYQSGPYNITNSLSRYTGVLVVTPHAECTVCPQSSSYTCNVGQKKF